ncbi:MAG: Unknown protein [uncultured Sulfurovum sp.]|uniref:NADH-ubiquinone oxidoreductase chain E (EC) n=1 Tax=uncultured Sulfurovum sp. TaxID=269237 RepID=A0A6S6S8K4_9BACT|nr:MAG: Unknown protein [uncultured Sulfurovum sp.]
MVYLLAEIVLYLVGAGLIGFVVGWFVRGEFINKTAVVPTENVEKKVPVTETKEVTKDEPVKEAVVEVTTPEKVLETTEIMKEELIEEAVTEVKKEEKVEVATPAEVLETTEVIKEELTEETVTEPSSEETNKPMLFTEAPATGKDTLSALKGLGPALEKKLNKLGIYTFEQIASWNSEQELWIGTQIAFPNKVTKEEWVKQAKELLENK